MQVEVVVVAAMRRAGGAEGTARWERQAVGRGLRNRSTQEGDAGLRGRRGVRGEEARREGGILWREGMRRECPFSGGRLHGLRAGAIGRVGWR